MHLIDLTSVRMFVYFIFKINEFLRTEIYVLIKICGTNLILVLVR
jgi:hypothetical protein